MRKIQKVQQLLDDTKSIRIRGVLKRRREAPKAFLAKFFMNFNVENDTIYVENEVVQTERNKRRSLGDIYGVMKYYYPDITLEQVTRDLYDLFDEVPRFRSSLCCTINKRVFYVGDQHQPTGIYDREEQDEHEMTVTQWKRQIK